MTHIMSHKKVFLEETAQRKKYEHLIEQNQKEAMKLKINLDKKRFTFISMTHL